MKKIRKEIDLYEAIDGRVFLLEDKDECEKYEDGLLDDCLAVMIFDLNHPGPFKKSRKIYVIIQIDQIKAGNTKFQDRRPMFNTVFVVSSHRRESIKTYDLWDVCKSTHCISIIRDYLLNKFNIPSFFMEKTDEGNIVAVESIVLSHVENGISRIKKLKPNKNGNRPGVYYIGCEPITELQETILELKNPDNYFGLFEKK